MKTNLILAGAHKSGTSTLFDVLSTHPDICMSNPKEPNLFSTSSSYKKEGFIYSSQGKKYYGDASASYFNEPYAIERAKLMLSKDTKVILVLRNPVDRAISAYFHLKKRLDELRPIECVFPTEVISTRDAIEWERSEIEKAQKAKKIKLSRYADRYDDHLWPFRYIESCLYSENIENISNAFENVMILNFDQLVGDQSKAVGKVFEFLEVDPIDLDVISHTNKTYVPIINNRFDYLVHLFATQNRLGRRIVNNKSVRSSYYRRFCADKVLVNDYTRDNLRQIFKSDVDRLAKIIDPGFVSNWV